MTAREKVRNEYGYMLRHIRSLLADDPHITTVVHGHLRELLREIERRKFDAREMATLALELMDYLPKEEL